jgi:hypothetical protein
MRFRVGTHLFGMRRLADASFKGRDMRGTRHPRDTLSKGRNIREGLVIPSPPGRVICVRTLAGEQRKNVSLSRIFSPKLGFLRIFLHISRRNSAAAMGGGPRSSPFCVVMILKRRVRSARPKPTCQHQRSFTLLVRVTFHRTGIFHGFNLHYGIS